MVGLILQLRNPVAGCNLVLREVVQRPLLNCRKKAIPQLGFLLRKAFRKKDSKDYKRK